MLWKRNLMRNIREKKDLDYWVSINDDKFGFNTSKFKRGPIRVIASFEESQSHIVQENGKSIGIMQYAKLDSFEYSYCGL